MRFAMNDDALALNVIGLLNCDVYARIVFCTSSGRTPEKIEMGINSGTDYLTSCLA